jgi:hypothetical protein
MSSKKYKDEVELRYGEEIGIQEDALDIESLEQAPLFLKYARAEADAQLDMDESKARFEAVKAEVELEIRENPSEYRFPFDKKGNPDIKESTILANVKLDPRVQEAEKEFNEARHEYYVLKAAVRAFDKRCDAIDNLIRLHGQSYFAGPKEPRNLRRERRKKEKEQTSRTGKSLRESKRKQTKEEEED